MKATEMVRYGAKHLLAIAVSVAAFTLFCTGLYLLMLLLALVTGSGLGSPALPVLVPLGSLMLSVLYSVLILLPVTMLTEWICRIRMGWPWWYQIPISFVGMIFALFAVQLVIALASGNPVGGAVGLTALLTVLLAVPLGLYWWSLQFMNGSYYLATRLFKRGRRSVLEGKGLLP